MHSDAPVCLRPGSRPSSGLLDMLLLGLHSNPCFQQRPHTIRGACHSPAFPDAGHALVVIFRVQGARI